jgi:hypothetical protein
VRILLAIVLALAAATRLSACSCVGPGTPALRSEALRRSSPDECSILPMCRRTLFQLEMTGGRWPGDVRVTSEPSEGGTSPSPPCRGLCVSSDFNWEKF